MISHTFYLFAIVFIVRKCYIFYGNSRVKNPKEIEIEISVYNAAEQLKKENKFDLLLASLNTIWLIAGLFSTQRYYFLGLILLLILPVAMALAGKMKHKPTFSNLLEAGVAALIFYNHFFV